MAPNSPMASAAWLRSVAGSLNHLWPTDCDHSWRLIVKNSDSQCFISSSRYAYRRQTIRTSYDDKSSSNPGTHAPVAQLTCCAVSPESVTWAKLNPASIKTSSLSLRALQLYKQHVELFLLLCTKRAEWQGEPGSWKALRDNSGIMT